MNDFTHDIDAEEIIRLVEGSQLPDLNGYDPFSLEEIMEGRKVPGVSVAVIKDFKVHWSKGYGVADILTGDKVTEKTRFQAASISKAVNAMAVLKAAQDGAFSLDEDVNKSLKSWKVPTNPYSKEVPITPRMLASHTSGLGDGFGFPGYAPSSPIPSIIQILNGESPTNVKKPEFGCPSLDAFSYSGAGSIILQQLLMDTFSKDYAAIMEELVLKPLEMNNSTFLQPLPESMDTVAARAHDASGNALDAKWRIYPEQSAAGLWTTPSDLAKFVIEVQKSLWNKSNKVLSVENTQQMVNPVGVGEYGFGLRVLKEGQGWYFEHGGGNWGFRCQIFSNKIKGYGFAIMTNSSQGSEIMNAFKYRIERHYGWDSIKKSFVIF